MPTITLDRGRLIARTPYEYRERMKTVPGARWDPQRRAWTYPATPEVARRLLMAVPDAEVDAGTEGLLQAARGADAAHTAKHDCPPPIPHEKTPSWEHQRAAFWFVAGRLGDRIGHCELNGAERNGGCQSAPGGGAMLALDMGCGKSKVAIDLVANVEGIRRVLVTCPLSVVDVWPEQFRLHSAVECHVVALGRDAGSVKKKRAAAARALEVASDRMPCVVVVNHESLWREPFGEWAIKQEWDLLVIDESHRSKAPGGRFSLFLSRLRDSTSRRVGLTGTPMPHSPLDIYGQARFLDPGLLGTSYARFKARYAVLGGWEGKQVVAFQNQDELAEICDRFMFQVKAGDVLDLPDSQDITRRCVLSPKEARFYAELEAELVAEVEAGTVTASNALVKALRLQQATSGHTKTDTGDVVELGTSKRDLLLDLLTDLDPREPVVVFCRFIADLEGVRHVGAKLGRPVMELSGRRDDLAAWKAATGGEVLAAQIQSGGVGIDATRARYCVFASTGYSLGDYQQAMARVLRHGQTRPVTFYKLVASGTIDEDVYRALEAKADMVEAVLGRLRRGDVGE